MQSSGHMGKLPIILKFIRYIYANKKWWLYPILLFILALGAIIVFAEESVLAPFIYPLF